MRRTAYHGTPITGLVDDESVILDHLIGNEHDFCVSFSDPRDAAWCDLNSRSWFGDNGIFPLWQAARKAAFKAGARFEGVGYTEEQYDDFVAWSRRWLLEGSGRCEWVVIPDPIGTGTQELDFMLRRWPSDLREFGVPVYHLDDPEEGESLDRAVHLLETYGRMAVGAVGKCRVILSPEFSRRMDDLFERLDRSFSTMPDVHFFRGLQLLKPTCDWPILCADSTDVARNHNRLKKFDRHYVWAVRQKLRRWDRFAQARSSAWPPARLRPLPNLIEAAA